MMNEIFIGLEAKDPEANPEINVNNYVSFRVENFRAYN
jgi:hypothetical protein